MKKVDMKIGSLDQNLKREDPNAPIDRARKESVADASDSGEQVTDRADLSKLDRKTKK